MTDGRALVVALSCVLLGAAQPDLIAQGPRSSVPDITGAWERYGLGAANEADPTVPSPAPPPPLRPRYLKEWQDTVRKLRAADAKGQPFANRNTACIGDGMPGMLTAVFPLEILQSRGQVTMIAEAYNQVRRILLDRPQKTLDEVEPTFYGHAVGRWEGDTLVVDTIGVKEYVRYQSVPHSFEMRIRERIRLVAPDVLWDEITVEDPVTLERPWTFTFAYRRMPDYTLLEYICEDNREYADEQGLQQIRVPEP
jgi:hypothetical protein